MDRLEDEYKPAFMEWQANPTPEGNTKFLQSIDPIVQKGVKMYGGSSPLAASQGRLLALEAARKYDPTQSRLQSHLLTQMQSLQRISRKQSEIVSAPEQLLQERNRLNRYTQELMDELGREPTDAELSDHLGVSPKRIAKIRSFQPGMNTGLISAMNPQAEVASTIPGQDDSSRLWLDIVHQDLSPMDQLIMEHTLGMNGKPKLSNAQIAAKLGRSPGAITQRKMRIQSLLDREQRLSPFIAGS